ncbi:hypothetical protein [Novosphingobium sp.]|uniref:hypothetical protein n=1 Tax=Novosphingobium sp. TaxID=1874826 RepID=UPI002FDD3076
MRISASLTPGDMQGPFAEWRRFAEARMERAALLATDRGARALLGQVRSRMAGAGLGRLGNGLSSTSDLREGRGIHRYADGGFSASGIVFIRTGSDRTRGAIEAYTRGADIRPVRSRWLWIPTDAIPRVSKRFRLTPSLWVQNGLDRRIGPLVLIKGINGYPLLVVKNVGVDLSGRKRSARSLTKRGMPRSGQTEKSMIIAFIGIPSTTRAARVDVEAIARIEAQALPGAFYQALGRI